MTVSIIIPVYNVASYIERCIRSVLVQTYQSLEVIIVDDCGKDNSMEIVERLLSEEGYNLNEDGTLTSKISPITFRVLHHDCNMGLSVARNTGIKAAKGEWIFFLDSDDELPSDSIRLLVERTTEDSEYDMVMELTKTNFNEAYYGISCFNEIQ